MISQGTVDRLMAIGEVLQATGLSRSSVYVMMRQGTFPTAVKVGARAVRWRFTEIQEWERSRPRAEGDLERAPRSGGAGEQARTLPLVVIENGWRFEFNWGETAEVQGDTRP